MQALNDFFNQSFFVIFGGVSSVLTLLAALYAIYLVLKGVIPVWYRLGMGLSRRKIAVFADNEFMDLKGMLVDSGLFREGNVVKIEKSAIKKAEGITLFLVHWKSFEEEIGKILEMKNDSTALVVYAPTNEGRIENALMERINNERNSIVVNLRGRLLNDVLVSMITTGYKN
jgi:hypothetical protein